MKRLIIFLLSLALLCSACEKQPVATETAVATPTPAPVAPFDYDSAVPFDTVVNSETEQDGVTIVDLTYAAHDPSFGNLGGRTLAFLVKPQGEGPFAGIVFLHPRLPTGSNRKTFLDEAIALAQHGAVCLLLQGAYPYMAVPKNNEEDRQNIIGQEIELRRAVDFLLAQPGVDPDRIGYVGQDYGGLYGGALAGIDHRFQTFVLVAALPDFAFADGYEFQPPDNYNEIMGDLNPASTIGNTAPASIFFQFGNNDPYISEEAGRSLYESASEPKQATWYEDNHNMTTDPAILQDRDAWLAEKLGLALAQP